MSAFVCGILSSCVGIQGRRRESLSIETSGTTEGVGPARLGAPLRQRRYHRRFLAKWGTANQGFTLVVPHGRGSGRLGAAGSGRRRPWWSSAAGGSGRLRCQCHAGVWFVMLMMNVCCVDIVFASHLMEHLPLSGVFNPGACARDCASPFIKCASAALCPFPAGGGKHSFPATRGFNLEGSGIVCTFCRHQLYGTGTSKCSMCDGMGDSKPGNHPGGPPEKMQRRALGGLCPGRCGSLHTVCLCGAVSFPGRRGEM